MRSGIPKVKSQLVGVIAREQVRCVLVADRPLVLSKAFPGHIAGDRIDVTLKIMGDVRHGSVMEARTLIKQAGIEISTAGAPHDA